MMPPSRCLCSSLNHDSYILESMHISLYSEIQIRLIQVTLFCLYISAQNCHCMLWCTYRKKDIYINKTFCFWLSLFPSSTSKVYFMFSVLFRVEPLSKFLVSVYILTNIFHLYMLGLRRTVQNLLLNSWEMNADLNHRTSQH